MESIVTELLAIVTDKLANDTTLPERDRYFLEWLAPRFTENIFIDEVMRFLADEIRKESITEDSGYHYHTDYYHINNKWYSVTYQMAGQERHNREVKEIDPYLASYEFALNKLKERFGIQ